MSTITPTSAAQATTENGEFFRHGGCQRCGNALGPDLDLLEALAVLEPFRAPLPKGVRPAPITKPPITKTPITKAPITKATPDNEAVFVIGGAISQFSRLKYVKNLASLSGVCFERFHLGPKSTYLQMDFVIGGRFLRSQLGPNSSEHK